MKPLSPGVQRAMDRFDEALARRRLAERQEGVGEVKREDWQVDLDHDNPVSVAADQHAYRTEWAYNPDVDVYVLALIDEDGEVMAAATYDYDGWMVCFERLKWARDEVERRKHAEGVSKPSGVN